VTAGGAGGAGGGPERIGGAIVRFERDRRTRVTINTISATTKPSAPIAMPPTSMPMKLSNEI
jgi:hypothetical protein